MLSHKYIIRGFLWSLHESHHIPRKGIFEKNDWFALVFVVPSWLCIMLGIIYQNETSVLIGAGMTAYGIVYFCVHDIGS